MIPEGDDPFLSLPVKCGTKPPSNSHTSIQRPLAGRRVLLIRQVIAYYGLIRASESLPTTSMGVRWVETRFFRVFYRPDSEKNPKLGLTPTSPMV